MNFRRIFLVKCLLLLLPSVKCSVNNWIYKAVNETALLSIAAPGHVYEATWKRDGQRLIMIKDNKVKYYANKGQCRCAILQNGTLQIHQVVKGDTGNYTVTVHQKDGKLKAEEATMFIVQEPVPQPILNAECVNKTIFAKCEVDQKAKDEEFIIELIPPNGRKIQKNASMLELQTRHSGTFRCVVKNQVSEKMAEKVIKCSGGGCLTYVDGCSHKGNEISCLNSTASPRNQEGVMENLGKLDLHLILIIAGGAVLLVILVIWLIYCIRRKKTNKCEDDDEERMMQALPPEREKAVRDLPPPPCAPTPRQLRVQQRPLPQPQPQGHQQAQPPRPRPRTQPRTPPRPKERP